MSHTHLSDSADGGFPRWTGLAALPALAMSLAMCATNEDAPVPEPTQTPTSEARSELVDVESLCAPSGFERIEVFATHAEAAPQQDTLGEVRPPVRMPQGARYTPWTSGRALAATDEWLLVADSDNGDLVLIQRATLGVRSKVKFGGRPEQVVVGPDGIAWVTLRHGGAVLRVDPDGLEGARPDEAVVEVLRGTEPYGVALDRTGAVVYVTLAGDDFLVALDSATGAELARIPTRRRPRSIAVSDFGLVVVHQDGDPMIVSLDADGLPLSGEVRSATLRVRNPWQAVTPDLFVPDGFTHHAGRSLSATVDPSTGDVLLAHIVIVPGNFSSLFEAMVDQAQTPEGFDIPSAGYGGVGALVNFDVPFRPVESTIPWWAPSWHR